MLKDISHFGPVTAIKIHDELAFIGHGPYLKVFLWKTARLVRTIKVFRRNKIHGIHVRKDGGQLLLWGANSLAMYNTQDNSVKEVSVNDWVTYVTDRQGVDDDANNNVLLLTAHNRLLSLHIETMTVAESVNCEQQSILYSGTVFASKDSTIVASGTVLDGVLLWNGETGQTIQQLSSHEGSIFGVAFSHDGQLVASCSDDRSIRVWTVSTGQLLCVGWGHVARIWQIQFLDDNTIVSASEDCTAQIWKMKKQAGAPSVTDTADSDKLEFRLESEQIFYGHVGKNVWACDASKDKSVLVTCGGDGRVRVWDIRARQEIERHRQILHVEEFGSPGSNAKKGKDTELFKEYAMYKRWVVVTSSKGRVFACDLITRKWKFLAQLQDTYPVVRLISSGSKVGRVCIAARCLAAEGKILVVELVNSDEEVEGPIEPVANIVSTGVKFRGKPNVVSWVDYEDGVSESSPAYLVQDQEIMAVFDKNSRVMAKLASPETFIAVSGWIDKSRNQVIIGSRHGAVAVYAVPKEREEGSTIGHSLLVRRIMSEDAITVVLIEGQGHVILGSRGGDFGRFNGGDLSRIEQNKLPRGNIEGGRVFRDSDECILYGFRTDKFFMWNVRRGAEIFSERCGGGHRNWTIDWTMDQSFRFNLAYTKTSEINIITGPSVETRFDNWMLLDGLHGREVRAAAFCPSNKSVLATGGEDTLIKLCTIDGEQDLDGASLDVGATYGRHVSGIQSLNWTNDGTHLISTSAREELLVWKITQGSGNGDNGRGRSYGYVRYVLPTSSQEPDLRITDTALYEITPERYLLATIYSDSTIKIWTLDLSADRNGDPPFVLLTAGTYRQCCLLNCEFIDVNGRLLLITSATDGYLAVWDISGIAASSSASTSQALGSPEVAVQVHQSGVKGLIVVKLSDSKILCISGGDDNAISASEIIAQKSSSGQMSGQKLDSVDDAHSCTITSIGLIDSSLDEGCVEFLSVGTDQQIKRWKYRQSFELIESRYTTIADTGVVAVESPWVFVGGSGSSLWKH